MFAVLLGSGLNVLNSNILNCARIEISPSLLQVGYALPVPQKPAWLKALLTDQFFIPCSIHLEHKKNEVNIFCVDCSASICQHCLFFPSLTSPSAGNQHITNSARVVFLNQRPQSRLSKGLGNSCETCDRVLQEPYRYCSVRCKVRRPLYVKFLLC
jgi:hypothetical protein